jgi:CTP:molybdopterin cytidylyltransferase MocA
MPGVTVAAVLLFATPAAALFDAAGRAACRRMVEAAWAGGATPIVVVADDPDGQVAAALAGSPAILAEPAPLEAGPAGQMARGIAVAAAQVTDTEAALVWPGRSVWVDAETVTTLIEHHGAARDALLRPGFAGATGWPALVPLAMAAALSELPRNIGPDELLARLAGAHSATVIETGDPGVVFDRDTPLDSLPAYAGPPEPAQPAPEWGVGAADLSDDAPLAGPALAPYGQAADPESD